MAVINEQLQITDAFSATFQRFNQMADKISGSLERVDQNLEEYKVTNEKAAESVKTHSEIAQRASSSMDDLGTKAEKAGNVLEKQGNQARRTQSDMTSLLGTVRNLVAALGGMAAIRGLINLSDELTLTQARLTAINDGLQTTAQLNNMIFAAAPSQNGSHPRSPSQAVESKTAVPPMVIRLFWPRRRGSNPRPYGPESRLACFVCDF